MLERAVLPIPVFDTLEAVLRQYKDIQLQENPSGTVNQWLAHCFAQKAVPSFAAKDYKIALNFLYSYRGSADTFGAYRRELERLIQWSWLVRNQSLLEHKREDIESFVEFCLKPPKRWIGSKKGPRFKTLNGERHPNPEWRPFEVSVSKKDHATGCVPDKNKYQFSQQALKALFGILGSFYTFLLQENLIAVNPLVLIRQKSKFLQKQVKTPVIRRLSAVQWETVINLVKEQALSHQSQERAVFILSCLYGMYLRISELVAQPRWTPTMEDFFKDSEGNWWFKTVGKGNKGRQIAVSEAMLEALKRYRERYLNLPPLPSLGERTPLISHLKNPLKPLTDERPIRRLVQACFDQAADQLKRQGKAEEAEGLHVATVHWLRHTGISEDVKHRPREHVRDDAGHSSGAITDRYIDVELRARAQSAKKKTIA